MDAPHLQPCAKQGEQPCIDAEKEEEAKEDASEGGDRINAVAAMIKWLFASGATGLNGLHVHETVDCGVGVTAGAMGISPGATIASIPVSCCLSVGRSASSAVGLVCNTLPRPPSPEYVMWLDMALGRRDVSHASHPFLAALPRYAPDLASWTDGELESLTGTDCGVAANAANNTLRAEHERIQPLLGGGGAYSVPLAAIRWARGCYLSRRLPPRLLDAAAPTTGAPGILLPFLDLLNHGKGTEIEWRGDGASVAFVAGAGGIAPHAEVLNNYGSKANDELLVAHGFALRDNEHDHVALNMTVAVAAGKRTLGPFYVHRGGDFPRELWRALADPLGESVSSDLDSPPEIDAESVEILLATCERKLAPFASSKTADAVAADGVGRSSFVAFYRIGQREILEDAIEALRSLLGANDGLG